MKNSDKSILIIEDEISLLNALEKKFTLENYNVYKASNGKEGFKMAAEVKPDVILLDIVMPIMDGAAMLKKMRQTEWGAKTKVIILTNLSQTDDVFNLLANNVQGYLIKSNWKLKDVVDKVKEVL